MLTRLKIATLAAALCTLTGCFQVEGVHYLHRYGESDAGSYRIKLPQIAYEALRNDAKFSEMWKALRSFSRPVAREEGDFVFLEDTTGRASMERFYDTSVCRPASARGYADCHFAFKIDQSSVEGLPGWSIDWEVILQPDMTLLSSNHHRTRRENGLQHLIWSFDSSLASGASVDFNVRVLCAQ
jgi:hypothetical protein